MSGVLGSSSGVRITVPKEYGWVLLDVVLLALLQHGFMPYHVARARFKYHITPPTVYADESRKDGKEFNRIQRGHQNTLEMAPMYLASLLIGGLRFPVLVATLGFVYPFARLLYFQGYRKVWISSRIPGFVVSVNLLYVLVGCLIWTACEVLWAGAE